MSKKKGQERIESHVQGDKNMADSQNASQVLKDEHKIILRVIDVLRRLVAKSESSQGFEHESLLKCVEFFRLFADACHHAKEEDLFFPALVNRGMSSENGPIAVMLYEHTVARKLTREMGDALDAIERDSNSSHDALHAPAHQYMDLLTSHIFKEDNILFNMGDQVLNAEDQKSLCGKFCEVGCRAFGGKKKEELELIATDLEKAWPAA